MNIQECEILFIASSEMENIDNILSVINESPVMTIAEADGFLERGGMIQLVEKSNKIRWNINRKTVDLKKLKFSSQLYRAAIQVVEYPK